MPVPTVITDLSPTIASNSPSGSDARTVADDHFRALAGFVAQLRDGPKDLTAGSVSAPSVAFTGDLNTGIYSTAADQVAVTSGGTQSLLLTATAASVPGTLTAGGLLFGRGGGIGMGRLTISTSAASGGADGDIHFQY